MSRYSFIRVLVLTTCAAVLLNQSAEAQQSRWFGSATCDVTTTAQGYSDTQTHRWHILPFPVGSRGASTYYPLIWTVTGQGSNSSDKWTYDGISFFQYLQFVVTATDPNSYHVAEGPQSCDTSGTHINGDGTDQICETQFAVGNSPIIVPKTATQIQQSETITIPPNTKVGYQEPANATHTASCTMNFQFGLVLLQPFPGPPKKPRRR